MSVSFLVPSGVARLNAALDPIVAFLRARRTSVAVSLAYVAVGLWFMARRVDMPQWYPVLLAFFAFKIVTDYQKCTFSYVECRLRGVGRDRGLLNALLGGVVSLRDVPGAVAAVALFTSAVMWYYFLVRGQGVRI